MSDGTGSLPSVLLCISLRLRTWVWVLAPSVDRWRCPVLHGSYTKPKGQIPDYNSPVVLHATNPSIADFCDRIHKGLLRNLK